MLFTFFQRCYGKPCMFHFIFQCLNQRDKSHGQFSPSSKLHNSWCGQWVWDASKVCRKRWYFLFSIKGMYIYIPVNTFHKCNSHAQRPNHLSLYSCVICRAGCTTLGVYDVLDMIQRAIAVRKLVVTTVSSHAFSSFWNSIVCWAETKTKIVKYLSSIKIHETTISWCQRDITMNVARHEIMWARGMKSTFQPLRPQCGKPNPHPICKRRAVFSSKPLKIGTDRLTDYSKSQSWNPYLGCTHRAQKT